MVGFCCCDDVPATVTCNICSGSSASAQYEIDSTGVTFTADGCLGTDHCSDGTGTFILDHKDTGSGFCRWEYLFADPGDCHGTAPCCHHSWLLRLDDTSEYISVLLYDRTLVAFSEWRLTYFTGGTGNDCTFTNLEIPLFAAAGDFFFNVCDPSSHSIYLSSA